MATEIKKVVKDGYQQFYDEAVDKLAKIEEIARAKVEELIKDDKERLEKIIDVCTEEVEVEVPDVVDETTEETHDDATANEYGE